MTLLVSVLSVSGVVS